MRGTRAALFAAALCLLAGSPATAAPGGLDPSFGTGGRIYGRYDNYSAAHAVVRTSDGRTVIAGGAYRAWKLSAPSSFVLARYLPNGRPDPSFGTRGVVRTSFGPTSNARDLVQLSDGRLVAIGMGGPGNTYVAMARYAPNGALDPTFGRSGKVLVPVGQGTPVVLDAEVALDGGVVISGVLWSDEDHPTPFVQRYLADGRPDEGFGTAGTILMTGAVGYACSVVAMPDGSVVVAGYGDTVRYGELPFFVRYLPTGVLDPTFGGMALRERAGTAFTAVVLGPGGLLLVGGVLDSAAPSAPHRAAAMVARFLPTGAPDPAFGNGGMVTVKPSPDSFVNELVLLPDGRMIAVGATDGRTTFDTMAWRVTALGASDTTFGRGGVSVQGDGGLYDTPYGAVAGPGNGVTTVGAAWPKDKSRRFALVTRFLG